MKFLLSFAWSELRSSGRSLWVFVACLTLGVTLIAASGGLYRVLQGSLLADTRALLGGDLEVDSNAPLAEEVLTWINETGDISLVIELNTMLGTPEGEFQRVELQTTDTNYPLYGQLVLSPEGKLSDYTGFKNGQWGAAIDPVLAERLKLKLGDKISIGSLQLEVRTLVQQQPDRNLNASWRGAPVLLSNEALQASGLIQPGSRLDYEYHVRTAIPVEKWQDEFYQAFPDPQWEVRTFTDRSERIGRRLNQIASGILMIGLSTLFIGGLGVFNSIQSYLQGKVKTIATLRAMGMHNRQLAQLYFCQVFILSGGASLVGISIGCLLALMGTGIIATDLPVAAELYSLLPALATALIFGLLTALTFALPAIGNALTVPPAVLFRSATESHYSLPDTWKLATFASAFCLALMILLTLPDVIFGLGFIVVVGSILLLLEGVLWLIRKLARRLELHPSLDSHFALRLALANQHRPGAPLRSSLLSLGSALTLVVACTLVVSALLRAVNTTIPEESPALVLYDVFPFQLDTVQKTLTGLTSEGRLDLAPLVRARLSAVNNRPLSALENVDSKTQRDALEQEYKLSYSAKNIDQVTLFSGHWESQEELDIPTMVMEDREANELGLKVGDTVTFSVEDRKLQFQIVGIYSQKGVQTRFWFEGIVADGALEGLIHRYVGAAYVSDPVAIQLQNKLGELAPNVVTARTAAILETARDLLGKASVGLSVIAVVSLIASALVLVSVIVAGRARQLYTSTILRSLGTRLTVIRRSLQLEYLFLALVTSSFAIALGAAIALPLLSLRMKLPVEGLMWLGAFTAISVSTLALIAGAQVLLAQMKLNPALLLRSEG